MTRDETKMILKVIKTAWPHSFAKAGRDELMDTLNLWAGALAQEDSAAVGAAVLDMVKSGEYRFAPNVGDVIQKARAEGPVRPGLMEPIIHPCPLLVAHPGVVGVITKQYKDDPLCMECERRGTVRCWGEH